MFLLMNIINCTGCNIARRIRERYVFRNNNLFDDINDGIRNRIDYIRKMVALYFRFSLLDSSFNIYLNEDQITLDELNDLVNGTQLLWKINKSSDPYITDKLTNSGNLKRKKS